MARELAKLAFGNLQDYTRLQGTVLVTDFSRTTRDQLAAVSELTVDLYPETADEPENQTPDGVTIFPPSKRLPVKRVRFKLADKRAALMDLAKLFGWVIEKREDVTKLEERLRAMTPEQREAEAHALYDPGPKFAWAGSRLALWDEIRARWTGAAGPDPFDRSATGFAH